MNFAQIRQYDVANGPGIRVSLFVSGCTLRCPNCFNQAYQNFHFGQPLTCVQRDRILGYLQEEVISGLTVLGGEPFDSANDLSFFLKEIRQHTDKSIWIYSGYTWEEIILKEDKRALLCCADVLVDGRFIEEEKDLRLRFRGSRNQRIIDVAASFEKGEAVILNESDF